MIAGLPHMKRTITEKYHNKRSNMLGFIDPLGNFHLNLRDHHVDPCKEDQLGFFKKLSYNEKMQEVRESIL